MTADKQLLTNSAWFVGMVRSASIGCEVMKHQSVVTKFRNFSLSEFFVMNVTKTTVHSCSLLIRQTVL